MKLNSLFPKLVLEVDFREKYTGSNFMDRMEAELVFCRYDNGSIYILKNREGETGYVSEKEFFRLVAEIAENAVHKVWHCKENIAVFLINERRL